MTSSPIRAVEVPRCLSARQDPSARPRSRARSRRAPPLAARELRRRVVDARREADTLEGGEGEPAALLAGHLPVEERDLDVVVDDSEGLLMRWNVWKTNPSSSLRRCARSRSATT